MKVGAGDLTYELVPGWERLPSGWSHPDVAAVATDSSNNVYVFARGEHPVIVYDRDGHFLGSWGEGTFSYRTHGIFVTPANELLLTDDGGNSVTRYSLDGTLLQTIGTAGAPSETGYDGRDLTTITHGGLPFNRPTNAVRAPSGDIYVSDGYGNARLHRFSEAGELMQSWGEPGNARGEFFTPHGVWAHTDGRIFVADRQNDRIQIFGPSGEYLTEWTDVQRPQDIFIDANNLVYIAELTWRKGSESGRRGIIEAEEPNRLSIYDIDGNLLLRWGDLDGIQPGHFVACHDVWVDTEGSIYVSEVTDTIAVSTGLAPEGTHTLQKFARI